jgi:23S rRNA U2552 (ribose-2'-O)-methylase RlmE/FtsJ
VTTLASLHLGLPQYDRSAVDGVIVPTESMREISQRLAHYSVAQRIGVPCIGRERADLVVAGCAILETIFDIWPAERLGIADRGIREGILRSLMATASDAEKSRLAARRLVPEQRTSNEPLGRDPVLPAHREEAHRLFGPLADAPAQRSLCAKGEGGRLAQPGRFQADRARREIRPAQRRAAGRRPRHRAGRMEPGRAPACASGQSRGHRPASHRPHRGRDDLPDGFHGRRGARGSTGHSTVPDLVISDMAANTVGHKQTDHLRTMGLVETAVDFAITTAPGGAFVAKVFAGGTDTTLLSLLKRNFTTVKHAAARQPGFVRVVRDRPGFKGKPAEPA